MLCHPPFLSRFEDLKYSVLTEEDLQMSLMAGDDERSSEGEISTTEKQSQGKQICCDVDKKSRGKQIRCNAEELWEEDDDDVIEEFLKLKSPAHHA